MRGFTLIELMITVAIIGILAAVALPSYRNYVVRTKVSEGLVLASTIKSDVSDRFIAAGTFPDNNAEAGSRPAANYAGEYTQSVEVGGSGVITITFSDPDLSGKTVLLVPSNVGGGVNWQCVSSIPNAQLPPNCR